MFRLLSALATVLVTCGAVSTAHAAASAPGRPVVATSYGLVEGLTHDGVDSFLGIPYAAPPVGQVRWQPPRPPAAWTGVRSAARYGPRCAAKASGNGPRSNAEDCLYLNVQRPTGATASQQIPVYFFIHGGGFVNGSSNQFDGSPLVRAGNAVVVTVNYRLGVFGFLGLDGLSGTGTGNYGFLDQQSALRWVHRNIAAFGGDPRRVTVGGESAGAFSVCAHLTASGSAGLFARALMESGSCPSRPLVQTERDSARVARALHCPSGTDSPACLRSRPVAALLDAGDDFSPTLTSGTSVLPRPPARDVARGRFVHVPVLVGSNRDEGRTFVTLSIGWSRAQYETYVGQFGPDADQILRRYPWPATADRFTAAYLLGAIFTDASLASDIGGCAQLTLTQTLARFTTTYAFEFDARHGPGLSAIPGYVWGAGHAAEQPYLFPSFDNGTPIAATFHASQRQLARDMTRYWTTFVLTGAPAVPGQASWPRFDRTGRLLALRPAGASATITTEQYRAEHRCDFWDSFGA